MSKERGKVNVAPQLVCRYEEGFRWIPACAEPAPGSNEGMTTKERYAAQRNLKLVHSQKRPSRDTARNIGGGLQKSNGALGSVP